MRARSRGLPGWNFAQVWTAIAQEIPSAPALVHGKRRLSWGDVSRRAFGLAGFFSEVGLQRQSKVAQYLHNCPEYMESVFGTFKASMVPVNTNYRYGTEELAYLWDNADAEAIVFHSDFADKVEALKDKLPKVKAWVWVKGQDGQRPDWAIDYEVAAATPQESATKLFETSPDDIYMVYTGGTTGMPKGVMWRQDDLFSILNSTAYLRYDDSTGLEGVRELVNGPGPTHVSACPLMHGTGALTAFSAWNSGGSIVTLESKSFDATELLDVIDNESADVASFVGDSFGRPVVAALDSNPGKWSLESLRVVISSGVMWSQANKDALLKHQPRLILVDTFSSSEAMGMGQSITTASGSSTTASFSLGPNAKVIDEEGNDIPPGSGRIGMIAVRGRNPLGYYKDPVKTSQTFRELGGTRWSVPGDFATVEADGTVKILGRGSVCINTGGEKVFPEEVEEVLKLAPSVADAAVVGVPDERFGEAVWAVVQLQSYPETGAEAETYIRDQETRDSLVSLVKSRLASFKAPKDIVFVSDLLRAPSGKMDYKRMREIAISAATGN